MVSIEIDEDSHTATVSDSTGSQIGKIEFYYVEGDPPFQPDYLKLSSAFLEGMGGQYMGQGIGTRCVELMIEATGYCICVSPDDGNARTDGSHLIGDGPRFARKLLKMGLAVEC